MYKEESGMKKIIALLMAAGLILCMLTTGLYAATGDSEQASEAASDEAGSQADDKANEAPVKDNIVRTKHTVEIQGKTIPYTAEAGTMVLNSGGVYCEMFYAAYTRDDVENTDDRPLTFAFNGGPGSSCIYIQFGCLGPRKAELDETGYALSLPAKIIDNENSILDMTDLVFIDPVGTGFSRAINKDEENEFFGYDNDIRSVGDFIRQYVNRHKRWGSEKYIAGESYGTTRAVGLSKYLSDRYGMYINGLMLVSTANDFNALISSGGNETSYALYIPTYAADAWYHGKVSEEYKDMELEDYLKEVRSFVEEEYVPVLFKGRSISKDEKEKTAGKLSGYIGVSEDFCLKNNLRISLDDFSTELLGDEKLRVGRLDGRITGPVTSGSLDDGTSDPSSSSTDIAFVNAYLKYVTEELEYETDTPFFPLALEVDWSLADDSGLIGQEDVVYESMSKNPYMKIWVICGYYDGATPFYSAEWVYNHVFLNEETEKNLSFTYYPSGHMFYVDKASFDQFRKDAEKWYR
jgi:carboxypeptidase C (cathepsin A)